MFSSLRGFKVFQISFILCISSSITIHLLVFWLVKARPSWSQFVFPMGAVLFVSLTGAFLGFLKSLLVSAIAYLGKPSLRWQLIVGSTAVLSLLEAWLYYELWTWTFPFG